MTLTIGLVANVYNEINALPGWLETHTPWFDDVRVLHAGPQGWFSNDGTIELLERWGIPVEFCAIDEGFGAVRTKALRMSPCDYVMLLDADERFHPTHRHLQCLGEPTPQAEVDAILSRYDFSGNNLPDWDVIKQLGNKLMVDIREPYDQFNYLRSMLNVWKPDAVATIRRHWHDMTLTRPTQNWHLDPDWQLRLVRNDESIRFATGTPMHEQLEGAHLIHRAEMVRGPFFDHYHFHFKRMEQEQRRHDIAIYNAIHQWQTPPKELTR